MPWTSSFQIDHAQKTVSIIDNEPDAGRTLGDVISSAFTAVINKAIDTNEFDVLHGCHSEPYIILGANQFCHLERFSHALFGIVGRGAHLTAYTRTAAGELKLWVPRRARHLFTYPGKLDSTVAGGVKATDTPFECIVAEAHEEATLDETIVRERVHSVGTLTYMTFHSSPSGREKDLISPEVLYVFDMELPESTVPTPCDDEVEQFYLMSIEEVQTAIKNQEFKNNSAMVMVDFFIRHGIITSDNEPAYVEIISRMHRRLPFATAPSVMA
jgi:8-oxo-dGTP pyrophosphatase MutT (NUDIX family)